MTFNVGDLVFVGEKSLYPAKIVAFLENEIVEVEWPGSSGATWERFHPLSSLRPMGGRRRRTKVERFTEEPAPKKKEPAETKTKPTTVRGKTAKKKAPSSGNTTSAAARKPESRRLGTLTYQPAKKPSRAQKKPPRNATRLSTLQYTGSQKIQRRVVLPCCTCISISARIQAGPNERPGQAGRAVAGIVTDPNDDDMSIDSEESTDDDDDMSTDSEESMDDGHNFECEVCDLGGELLCCDTCTGVFHLKCHRPPLKGVPKGSWYCSYCKAAPGVTTSKGPARRLAEKHVDEMEQLKSENVGDKTRATPAKVRAATSQSAAQLKTGQRTSRKKRLTTSPKSKTTERANKKPRVTPEKPSAEDERSNLSMDADAGSDRNDDAQDSGQELQHVEETVLPDDTNKDEEEVGGWEVENINGFCVSSRSIGPLEERQGIVTPTPSMPNGGNRETLHSGASEGNEAHVIVQEPGIFSNNTDLLRDEASALVIQSLDTAMSFPSTDEFVASLDWHALMLSGVASLVGWALWVQMLARTNTGDSDWAHLIFMSLFGLIFHGPLCYASYTYLEGAVKGAGVRAIFTKVGIQHVVWRPILLSIMFMYSGWLSRLLPDLPLLMWRRCAQEMQGLLLWSLLDVLQFQFVPAKLRVFVLNVAQIIFFAILISCESELPSF